ncbi:MAG: hypothetical protein ACFCGT_11045 [Sandaracinaceae bacterium]
MVLALVIAAVALALGTALGLSRTAWALGAVRTFAVVSALAVVLSQLLPDALAAVGPAALLALGLGMALPAVLERLAASGEGPRTVGLEISYGGLLIHRLGDGLGLGAYANGAHVGHDHHDVFVALAAHTVPVTALVVLAFSRARGLRAGLLRALGLGAATFLGVGVAYLVPVPAFSAAEPWVAAAVAGLLLHVVLHDLHDEGREPAGVRERLLDGLALGAGALVLFVGGHVHHHGAAEMRAELALALARLTLAAAPAILAGLVLSAAFGRAVDRLTARWAEVPVAAGERRAETLVLSVALLGPVLAVLRLVTVGAAVAAARLGGRPAAPSHAREAAPPPSSGFGSRLDAVTLEVAPWLTAGLLAAAAAEVLVGQEGAEGALGAGTATAAAAIATAVSPAAATPLLAVLLGKGVSAATLLAGVLLGRAGATLATPGLPVRARAAVAVVAALGGAGLAVLGAEGVPLPVGPVGSPWPPVSIASAVLLALLVLRSIWRTGFVPWLGALARSPLPSAEPTDAA